MSFIRDFLAWPSLQGRSGFVWMYRFRFLANMEKAGRVLTLYSYEASVLI